jgi:formate dehydrogenase assembly factor FdhD
MGAGQDAVEVGTHLGVDAGYSLTYDADGTDAALGATGANISMLRRSVAAGVPVAQARDGAQYTSAQRARASGSATSSTRRARKPNRFRGGPGGPASV